MKANLMQVHDLCKCLPLTPLCFCLSLSFLLCPLTVLFSPNNTSSLLPALRLSFLPNFPSLAFWPSFFALPLPPFSTFLQSSLPAVVRSLPSFLHISPRCFPFLQTAIRSAVNGRVLHGWLWSFCAATAVHFAYQCAASSRLDPAGWLNGWLTDCCVIDVVVQKLAHTLKHTHTSLP